ncbi:MAG: T9SS type A sorting domain-containing protein [Agriterribacter sp.]
MDKILRLVLCILIIAFGSTSVMSQYISTPKSVMINKNCGGYYEFLPASYDDAVNSNKQYPLIIDITGSGGEGNGSTEQLDRILQFNTPYFLYNNIFPDTVFSAGQPFSFLVMAPQFTSRGNGSDIKDVIDFMIAQYRIDTTRIYLTGFSNGGQPAWAYPCLSIETASKIAALVPVAGVNTNAEHEGANYIAEAKLPVWALHSAEDQTVQVTNSIDFVNAINSYNPVIEAWLTLLDGEHRDTWNKVYDPEARFSIDDKELSIYEWMLQYDRVSEVLPIKLVSFNGKVIENGNIQLNWLTADEFNNDFFKLEKSKDSFSFIEISHIDGRSNSLNGNAYSFIDDKPYEGINYYRLSQTDMNGKKTYFPVLSITRSVINATVKIYPTVIHGEPLKLKFANTSNMNVTIQIVDLNGRTLYRQTGNFQNEVTIAHDRLSPGVNIVNINSSENPLLNMRTRIIKFK